MSDDYNGSVSLVETGVLVPGRPAQLVIEVVNGVMTATLDGQDLPNILELMASITTIGGGLKMPYVELRREANPSPLIAERSFTMLKKCMRFRLEVEVTP